jgi:tRNA/rRNA methyltransferase
MTRTAAAPAGAIRLRNVSIVLVEPQSPGNVGSVARVMMNTGFNDLVLINPCPYHNNEAYSMACKADPLLLSARTVPGLDAYAPGAGMTAGATRRSGRLRHPVLTLDEAAPMMLGHARGNKVSILFGREDRGLTNEELRGCDMLFEIPTHQGYPSLNLSHAVLLVCHRLFTMAEPRGATIVAADRAGVEEMFSHMERMLRGLGYGEKGGKHLLDSILRGSRRLFGRTGLMQKEVNMLRGIFTRVEKNL